MIQPKEYEIERLKNQFSWYLQFIVRNWPADPFCGQWIDVGHLPEGIVARCKLAQARLSSLPQSPGFGCFRRWGETSEVRLECGWLDGYLKQCAIAEPSAHEPE